jgi:hypothetical protein
VEGLVPQRFIIDNETAGNDGAKSNVRQTKIKDESSNAAAPGTRSGMTNRKRRGGEERSRWDNDQR